MTGNPLTFMNTPALPKKDNARKAEEMFSKMVQDFARNGEVQGRPFLIELEQDLEDSKGRKFNRYRVPGENGAELTVEFRNFSVDELQGTMVRSARIHSPSNMAMIASITQGNPGNTLSFILFRMNDIVRKTFQAGECYYVLQHVRHMSHYFFYNDTTDNSMVVVKYSISGEAKPRAETNQLLNKG